MVTDSVGCGDRVEDRVGCQEVPRSSIDTRSVDPRSVCQRREVNYVLKRVRKVV